MVQLSHPIHDYWKNHSFDYIDLCWKVMCQLFNTLPRFVIASLPRSKSLLNSWLQSPSAMIMEPKKRIYVTASTFSPSICYERIGLDAMILVFWMWNFKPAFSLSSFLFIKKLFSSSSLSAIRVTSSTYLRLFISACASSSLAFSMTYSAYKLNKQGDNIQPWCTPFPIWERIRWWSRRTCAHLLLQELQNCNSLLNNHRQENIGSHQEKIPHIQGQRRSPNKMLGQAKSRL